MSELNFGLFNGDLIHISNAKNGQKCDCVCPHCKLELIARQGKTNSWCFAHKNKIDCEHGQESAIHKFAKDVLAKNLRMKVPIPISSNYAGKYIKFNRADLEKRIDDIIPDVILYSGKSGYEVPLLAEIYVTHAVDEVKYNKIKLAKLSAVEIDLSKVDFENFDKKATEDLIIHGLDNKKWIYNNAQAELYTNASEKVIIAEHSCNIIDFEEAKRLTSKLFESTEKIELMSRLNLVEEDIQILNNIKSDIENAEIKLDKYYINHANMLVDRLNGSVDLTEFGKRINIVREAIEQALIAKTTEVVVKAEGSNIQSDVRIAENLINEICDEEVAILLISRLRIVQSNIDEKVEAELVAKATGAVVKAETNIDKSAVYLARELVKGLKNGDAKQDLNMRLDGISSIIEERAENILVANATEAVVKAEQSNLESDVYDARVLIADIFFNAKVPDLNARLSKVQSVIKNIERERADNKRRQFYNHLPLAQLFNEYRSISCNGKENIIICYANPNGELKAEPNLCGKDSCNKCKKFISDKFHDDIEDTCYVVRKCNNYKMNIVYILAYLKDRRENKEESTQLGLFT